MRSKNHLHKTLFFLFFAFTAFTVEAQEKDEHLKSLLNSKDFVFKVQSVSPTSMLHASLPVIIIIFEFPAILLCRFCLISEKHLVLPLQVLPEDIILPLPILNTWLRQEEKEDGM